MATRTDGRPRAFAALVLCAALATSAASALAADDVEQARKAFTEAYADERAGRFAEALDKLAQVRRVRDTASVRYRIGACEEGRGRLVEARDSYIGVPAVARPEDGDVVASARAKVAELEGKLGAISLRVDGATEGAAARLDDRPLELRAGKADTFVAPGEHRVSYAPPGEAEVVTPISVEAGKKTVVVLDRRGARTGPAPAPVATTPSSPPREGETSPLGVVAVVAGGALVVASVVSLVLRESAIGTIEDACPEGRCPRAKESDVESARSRAEVLMPVAAVTGAAGILALGGGIYLLARPAPPPPTSRASATEGLVLSLGGRF